MSTRRAKQVIYGAFYLIVITGVITLIRFTFSPKTPLPACGTDCPPAVPTSTANIVVGDLKTFLSSPGHSTFLARVENHNGGFAAKTFEYELKFKDASGTVISSLRDSSFLYGSEVKYVVIPNVPVPQGMDHAELSITNAEWVADDEMGLLPRFGNPLPITGSSVASGLLTVNGTMRNDDPSAFENITIVAIFYGSSGFPVGASQAQLDSIAPGEVKQFAVSYPTLPDIDPLLTKAYAYALRP